MKKLIEFCQVCLAAIVLIFLCLIDDSWLYSTFEEKEDES